MTDLSGLDAFSDVMDRLTGEIEQRAAHHERMQKAETELRETRRENKAEDEATRTEKLRLASMIERLLITYSPGHPPPAPGTVDEAHALIRAVMDGSPFPARPPVKAGDDVPF